MKSDGFDTRLAASAADFAVGVQPALERQMNSRIFPIYSLYTVELARLLDQSGIDAFTFDENLNSRALASRMNYTSSAAKQPMFSFRYALWDERTKSWDCRREYFRKLDISRRPADLHLFPYYHVESYCRTKFSAEIGWSFIAKTSDILEFAEAHLDEKNAVLVNESRKGERRKYISVFVEAFAREYSVEEVMLSRPEKLHCG